MDATSEKRHTPLDIRIRRDYSGSQGVRCCGKTFAPSQAERHLVRHHGHSATEAAAILAQLKAQDIARRTRQEPTPTRRTQTAPCACDAPRPYYCGLCRRHMCEGCYFRHVKIVHRVDPGSLMRQLDAWDSARDD